jgi:hypothetical protein
MGRGGGGAPRAPHIGNTTYKDYISTIILKASEIKMDHKLYNGSKIETKNTATFSNSITRKSSHTGHIL